LEGAVQHTEVSTVDKKKETLAGKQAAAGEKKGFFLISLLAGLLAGLCCFTPIVLVLLGLATLSAATSLGNVLYGNYAWYFRAGALVFLALALWLYFRQQGICTLDQARRERNRIINTSLIALIFAIGVYIVWTYIIVQYWGIAEGLPWAQYDESWAIPVAAVVLGIGVIFYVLRFRRFRRSGKV
jgi:hypothetical protein